MDFFTNSAFSYQLFLDTAATSVAVGYFLFFIWKRNLIKSTNFQWQEMILRTAHGGYYVWDAKKEREYFSINLVNIFRMREDQQSFNEFIGFFEYEKDIFEKAFAKLVDGSRQRFTYNVVANICGRKRHFLCSGYRVEDKEYEFQGVILWFFDVTEYMLKMKETTEEMQRSRQERRRLSDVLNSLPIPIWQRDEEFRVRYCNLAYSRLADEDKKRHAIPEMAPNLAKEAKKAVSEGKPFDKEQFVVEDGERKLLHIHEFPNGQGGATVGYAVDVSHTLHLRKQLEAHASAHADLLESSSSAMAIYGKDMKLLHYNQSFARLFGLETEFLESHPTYPETLETLRIKRMLPEQKDFAAFRKEQTDLFSRNLKEPVNEFYHLPDGRSLRVIVISHALGGLLFVYEDLTDSLRIQSSYNRLVAVQKATLDYLKEGILLVGTDGRVSLFNPMYQEIFPGTESLLASRPHIGELLDSAKTSYENVEDWRSFRAGFVEKATGRSRASLTQEIDGKIYNVSFIPLPDGQTLASFLEVTAAAMVERTLRERNAALEEADKLKNDFLAGISYDLRTPLTSIIGFSEALKEEYFGGLGVKQRAYIMDIYGAANQLLAMINNIIDVARLRAGKFELQCTVFPAASLPAAVLRMAEGLAKEKGVRLRQECAVTPDALLVADASRLEQMLFYVLHRAILACGSGGADIVVEAKPAGANGSDYAQFSVRVDVKEGDADVKDVRAFLENVHKGDKKDRTTEADFSSFLVHDIIERHGGVAFAGESLEQDTVFKCLIPVRGKETEGGRALARG
jgi:signal transduction histidine kinase